MKKGFCDFQELNFTYFDYAATTFMPKRVAEKQWYYNTNIAVSAGRGKGKLANIADYEMQRARKEIKDFFWNSDDYELIFYRGATYALNEIALSIEHMISPMDIILLGPYEHHSNLLPWRELAHRTGAIVFEMPLLEDGTINGSYLEEIKDRIRIIAFSSVSNSNGYRLSVEEVGELINDDVFVIVDDSQLCGHGRIECSNKIDCHIVNSHKMYGPKGVAGALVSKRMIDIMKPCVFGGGMIERIGFPNRWKDGVEKFESGTIDLASIVAWRESCNYLIEMNLGELRKEECKYHDLVEHRLRNNAQIEIISDCRTKSLLSFVHKSKHAHDIDERFSEHGIIVRTGHLCSQNSVAKYGMNPIVRISFGASVDEQDIDKLMEAIEIYL